MKNLDSIDQETIKKNERFVKMYGDSIQGNIARNHGREHTAYLFLRWPTTTTITNEIGEQKTVKTKASNELKKYLKGLANDDFNRLSITSAAMVGYDRSKYGKNKSPNIFMGAYFTSKGLEWMGKTERNKDWNEIHTILKKSKDLQNGAGKKDEVGWDENFKVEPHLMIALSHSSEDLLKLQADKILKILKIKFNADKGSFIEYGNVYRNRLGQSVEHFGYADGLSQPWFFKSQVISIPNNNIWNPIRSLKDGFFKEEAETSKKIGESCYGSFLVYRKFEQDVAGFNDSERKVEKIGRLKDGSPIVEYFKKSEAHTKANLSTRELYIFDHSKKGDDGIKCPKGAHIKKMNDRPNAQNEMIIRRGMTYGTRIKKADGSLDTNILPLSNVGLHFISFQKDINTFQKMINCSMIGDIKDEILTDRKTGLIKIKGGANFYAPSIDFFQQLI